MASRQVVGAGRRRCGGGPPRRLLIGAPVVLAVLVLFAGCGSRAETEDSLIDTPAQIQVDATTSAPPTTDAPATTAAPTTEAPASTAVGAPTTEAVPPPVIASTSGSSDSDGCGGDVPALGTATEETLPTDDGDRTYLQYVPSDYDPASAVPLVLNLHGYTMGAVLHRNLTAFDDLAEAEGFVTITPDGVGPPSGLDDGNDVPVWNVSGSGSLPDDAAFVLEAVDRATSQLCIDLDEVFVVGLSNGGHLASTLVCDEGDRFAAVATVAGVLAPASCGAPDLPLLTFHGTDDQFVPFEGGEGSGIDQLNPPDTFYDVLDSAYEGVELAPIDATVAAWAARNGCEGEPAVEVVSAEVERRAWDCAAPVQLYVVEGGGGTWPGSALFQAVEATSGHTTMDIDANELIWAFFSDAAG